eukprot:CAMPEP_0173404084 /NCGR_PEP_ID=MMETSP1356-20130122/58474_1 /TAXON_ID=77927 ORGANISM="Hemiselmis virescens, Strain PCC157" /NCGR_SAMPLE_ID=MMETSP1356 /ASSEMBLY_ACC=CAM_ASM_000847 /LENGTH=58 /DNA_ID=CAMNT_0014364703 /DNA_START=144 /DNA_END=317 /DNA_ORIENTATION=+
MSYASTPWQPVGPNSHMAPMQYQSGPQPPFPGNYQSGFMPLDQTYGAPQHTYMQHQHP